MFYGIIVGAVAALLPLTAIVLYRVLVIILNLPFTPKTWIPDLTSIVILLIFPGVIGGIIQIQKWRRKDLLSYISFFVPFTALSLYAFTYTIPHIGEELRGLIPIYYIELMFLCFMFSGFTWLLWRVAYQEMVKYAENLFKTGNM